MSKYSEDFEVIARAVVVKNGSILLCRAKGRDYFFFPGGHVEKGETAEKALERELEEELGAESGKMSFIGAVENIFKDSYDHHEINLVFEAEVTDNGFQSKEDHLEFKMISLDEFKKAQVLPMALKGAVQAWLGNRQKFWKSQS